jgi:hypothetical protein
MNAWTPRSISALNAPVTVGASQTDVPVSKQFGITAGGSRNIVMAAKVSGLTVGAGVTLKLRTSIGTNTAQDSKTASVTADGIVYIKLIAEASGDQTYLPLLSLGQLVISTGAGSAVTVQDAWVIQED